MYDELIDLIIEHIGGYSEESIIKAIAIYIYERGCPNIDPYNVYVIENEEEMDNELSDTFMFFEMLEEIETYINNTYYQIIEEDEAIVAINNSVYEDVKESLKDNPYERYIPIGDIAEQYVEDIPDVADYLGAKEVVLNHHNTLYTFYIR